MSAKTLHHIAAADLPQIIVKCMLTFSIVVVTHGVNAATVFLYNNNERYVSGKRSNYFIVTATMLGCVY